MRIFTIATALTGNGDSTVVRRDETRDGGGIVVTSTVLGAPTGPSATAVASGGTFAAATYFWKITAIGPSGESAASAEVSAAIVLNGSANLAWTAVPGATSYRVYRGTATNSQNVYYAVGNVVAYTDTNAASTGGTPPSATPTVTVNIQGSVDGSAYYNIPYALVATPATFVITAITITTAVTTTYLLLSANTNATLSATATI